MPKNIGYGPKSKVTAGDIVRMHRPGNHAINKVLPVDRRVKLQSEPGFTNKGPEK